MGKKTSPIAFRIPLTQTWRSRWFEQTRHYPAVLREDYLLRTMIRARLKNAGLERIDIERSPRQLTVIVSTSRPGMVIGRGGEEIEKLQAAVMRSLKESRGAKSLGELPRVKLDIQEVRSPESSAVLVAERIIQEIEKRLPFRRILRQTVERVSGVKGVDGVRVQVSGRLDGAEMSRTQWLARGRLPLSNLRADIDFGKATAYCSYGTVGVKVWIYKGDVFENKGKN